MGSSLIRFPVALKIALAMVATAGGDRRLADNFAAEGTKGVRVLDEDHFDLRRL